MRRTSLIGIVLSAALLGGACSAGSTGIASPSPTGSYPAHASPSGADASTSGSSTILQPLLAGLNSLTRRRLAPESARIDLVTPTFSDPTAITNPLFPIGDLRSAILLGRLHGKPWRAETTLLPDTKIVVWNGQQIETLQSQFVAYLDGRIFEVAVDLYAQADDGSVWYFGEDAFTYERGRVVDTEGTWVAGQDGPPEQVTVKKVGEAVMGPTGLVEGAMVAQELHMDEVRLEEKYFAPGYGEFFSGGGRTFEETALAVPADAHRSDGRRRSRPLDGLERGSARHGHDDHRLGHLPGHRRPRTARRPDETRARRPGPRRWSATAARLRRRRSMPPGRALISSSGTGPRSTSTWPGSIFGVANSRRTRPRVPRTPPWAMW